VAPVAIGRDVLTASISRLPDDALLKRWAQQEFTDDALPIAAEEIRRRGLSTTQEVMVEVAMRETAQAKAIRGSYFSKIGRGVLYVILAVVSVAVATIGKMVLPLIFN
jgi:hypothetical protein